MSKDPIHFRAHRSELLTALAAVIEAIPAKDNIPILENVLLQPDGDRLLLRGTNLDLEIETRCELLEASAGEGLTIAADEFYRIVKNMPESAEITLAPGKFPGQVTISGGRSRFNLHTLPVSDFPSIGTDRPQLAFTIQANILTDALGKVAYAMNTTMKDRPYLSGTFIEGLEDGKLSLCATDGKKMAVKRISPSEVNTFEPPIIPVKTVQAIRKLFGQSKSPCSFFVNDRKLAIECDDLSLVSKLVDGTFPDYRRLIPVRSDVFLRADRAAVSKAITRVSVIAGDISKASVRLDIAPGSMQIELMARDGQNASEPVDIEFDGDSHLRGFNPTFVNETLSSISTTSFCLHGTDPGAPGHFTPDGDADEDYIVMPMRVS
ncbi:DNA polymerase III subunit beta [Agrobacterium sp. ST15.13.015]|uniref:DNA polymerase III subunit beta n=1 Tax=Agrobacterium sp. ST15.13.015 TaxID=3017319 RepID=UPI0022C15EE6|nr:DNA polymerase III subunit beta [Agrobacterium sp. ST15.13.015]MCZ7501224.1 DNA polymerase III subunit beta [Rhizobium rhizogenes]